MGSITENLKTIYMSLYVVAVIMALWRFNTYKHTFLRYFPIILIFNLVSEYAGEKFGEIYGFNAIIYNLHSLLSFIFIFIIFRLSLISKKLRNSIVLMVIVFSILFIYYLIVDDFLRKLQYEVFIYGAICSIICIIFYYIEILKSDRVINIKHDPVFWVSVGFLLYYSGAIPIEIIRKMGYFGEKAIQAFTINNVLIIIMNVCFIIGFLVAKPSSLTRQ